MSTKQLEIHTAKDSDIVWIANLEKLVYSGIDAIPLAVLSDWYQANSHAFYIFKMDGENIGHIDILPVRENVFSSCMILLPRSASPCAWCGAGSIFETEAPFFQNRKNRRNTMSDTLFDRLGGEAAVNAAVDIFYRKVLADDRINQFFEGIDKE